MNALTISEAAGLLADPLAYTDEGRLHDGLELLREQCPVVWVDHPPYRPFWAVTKHTDILEIERDNALWITGPRPSLRPQSLRPLLSRPQALRPSWSRQPSRPDAQWW